MVILTCLCLAKFIFFVFGKNKLFKIKSVQLKVTFQIHLHSPQPTQKESIKEVDPSPFSLQPRTGNPLSRPMEAASGHNFPQQNQWWGPVNAHIHIYCSCDLCWPFCRR